MPTVFARRVASCLTLLGLCLLPWPAGAAEEPVEVRSDVKIPMCDGVQLSAHVFLPRTEGRHPTILARTPYGKGGTGHGPGWSFAQRGYVFVSQDCRGRGDSQGEWVPFVHERADGEDTYRWILDQPWSDGRIGTTGGSYLGYTQWISAPGSGRFLKAAFTMVPLVDPYDDLIGSDGGFQLHTLMGWGSGTVGNRAVRDWKRDEWLRALPLCEWGRIIGQDVPFIRDWVTHPQFDAYWEQSSIRGRHAAITTPMYTVDGWFDLYAASAFAHVGQVRRNSQSAEARRHQHLLVGPWPHSVSRDRKLGDVDFGPASLIDLNGTQTAWLDHWLQGTHPEVDGWPPLRIFVMGRNQWRDEQEWPLARTQFTAYYFHSQGGANTSAGNGGLSTDRPSAEPQDRFVYDPDDPVPTLGGCCLGGPAGPRDQTAAEQRPDVLVFSTEPLTAEVEVTGPVKVVLHAAASAPATDWTAKLVDVWPDGRPINLCDGIVRARCRSSAGPAPQEPGPIDRYEIDAGVTSNVFLTGHRIRVEISSSNFPRFDRNLNTGHPWGTDAERRPSTQTIYHDGEHPSQIVLPIIAAAPAGGK